MITLATLPQATEQEVFDQVVNHLLNQKRRSVKIHKNGVIECLYRLGHLSCAGGCFMSDEEYKPEFEGKLWTKLIEEGHIPPEHKDLIISLQLVHDTYLKEDWEERLKHLAKIRKLKFNYTPLNN